MDLSLLWLIADVAPTPSAVPGIDLAQVWRDLYGMLLGASPFVALFMFMVGAYQFRERKTLQLAMDALREAHKAELNALRDKHEIKFDALTERVQKGLADASLNARELDRSVSLMAAMFEGGVSGRRLPGG